MFKNIATFCCKNNFCMQLCWCCLSFLIFSNSLFPVEEFYMKLTNNYSFIPFISLLLGPIAYYMFLGNITSGLRTPSGNELMAGVFVCLLLPFILNYIQKYFQHVLLHSIIFSLFVVLLSILSSIVVMFITVLPTVTVAGLILLLIIEVFAVVITLLSLKYAVKISENNFAIA